MQRGRLYLWLGIFVLNFLATSEFWSLFVSMDDEAVTVLGATRLLHGELPYRDWDTRHFPGSYFVSALWFALVGAAAPAPRLLFSLISALTAVLVQGCADRLLPAGPVRYLPALLFTSLGVMAFPVLSYHWMGSCCLMLVLYALLGWADGGGKKGAAGTGAALALSFWMLQSVALVGLLVTALATWRYRLRGARLCWGIWLGGSILLWSPLATQVPQIWQDSVADIGLHLRFNYQPFSLSYLAGDWAVVPKFGPAYQTWQVLALMDEVALQSIIYLSIYPLALGALIWGERTGRRPLSLLGCTALAMLLVTHRQQSTLYVMFHSPLWVLLVGALVARLPYRGRVTGLLLGLELLGWGARWGLRHQAFVYPVITPMGVYYSNNSMEAEAMTWLAGQLRSIPAGTELLAYPFNTSVYTLFRLTNPIREPVLQPGLYPEASFQRCLDRLARRKVPWLLLRERGPQIAINSRVSQLWDEQVQALTRDYQPVSGWGTWKLYRRK